MEIIKPSRGRPSKLQSSGIDAKQHLLKIGLAHLTEHGFVASGLERILKTAGIPKGSFYYYFSSKEAFGQAVLEEYARYFSSLLGFYLLDEQYQPLIRITNFVEHAKRGMQKYQFSRGCLVGNLGQEISSLPESYRAPLIQTLQQWEALLKHCLYDAKASGHIQASLSTDEMANFFWIAWEGAVARAKLEQTTAPLDNFLLHFMRLIKTA